ncbi:MAG: hypothetical protein MR567_00960 [Oscillospiraceae bacterium]|nr:hypothetical protein [Oscillospiraceae bacterium]
MYEKITKVLDIIFSVLFVLCIGMALVSSFLYTDNNADYTVLQPELRTPEPIECVLDNRKSDLIYVCYTEGSAVNVYDSESGNFLWAVSVPYLRHTYFDLAADRLVIYGANEAYFYDCKTGAFLEKGESDAYGLSFELGENTAVQGEPVPGEIYYDLNDVYKVNPDGSRTMIVCAPWWVDFFNVFIWWMVGFSAGLGKGALMLFDKVRQGVRAKKAAQGDFSGEYELTDKTAIFTVRFYQAESVVHILLAVIIAIFTGSAPKVTLLAFPVAIVFILSQIVLVNLLDRRTLSTYEKKTVSMWKAINWSTLIVAFLTLVVIMTLNGGEIQL